MCSHQRRPMILSRLLTVFNLIFVSVSFIFMSRSNSRILSWESLNFLDDWTFVMWSFLIFELAWSMALVRSWYIFSYSSMDFLEGRNVCRCSRSLNIWKRLFYLVSNLIFDVYLFWYLIWSSLSLLASGDLYGDLFFPNSISCEIFIQSSLWYELGTSWKGRYTPWEIIMPCESHIPSISWPFLFDLVVPIPCTTCLLVIIYVSPRFTIYLLILLLRICLLIYPIIITWSPLSFHDLISFTKSPRKATLRHCIILMLWKWVRCWKYTDPAPPPVAGGTGL